MFGSLAGNGGLQPFPFARNNMPGADSHVGTSLLDRLRSPGSEQPAGSKAVTAAGKGDEVNVNANAKKAADLQAIIDALNNSEDSFSLATGLKALSEFVTENTKAGFSGGVLEEIGSMVGNVLETIEENPDALGNFSFAFAASFEQQKANNHNSSYEQTSFSFSFQFQSADTVMSAELGFANDLLDSVNGSVSQSAEYARVAITTYNANVDTNPVLDSFGKIAGRLLGSDPLDLLGLNEAVAGSGQDASVTTQSVLITLQQSFTTSANLLEVVDETLQALEEYLKQIKENAIYDNSRDLSPLPGDDGKPNPPPEDKAKANSVSDLAEAYAETLQSGQGFYFLSMEVSITRSFARVA